MPADAYLDPYRESVARHGTGFRATLWASERSQQIRFRVFTEMVYFADKRVLDAGCSRGDFAAYLLEAGQLYDRYIGIDGIDSVIAYARQRGLPRCRFESGDLVARPGLMRTGRPHIVCISGTLNTMTDEQVMAVLEGAWQAARETLAFNFLSDRCGPEAPPQDQFARRLDALGLLDWALSCTWDVRFRQDYFPAGHDATIVMRKT
jgi:SAM-dependent methyltransferase